jgi:hypothetical protein
MRYQDQTERRQGVQLVERLAYGRADGQLVSVAPGMRVYDFELMGAPTLAFHSFRPSFTGHEADIEYPHRDDYEYTLDEIDEVFSWGGWEEIGDVQAIQRGYTIALKAAADRLEVPRWDDFRPDGLDIPTEFS